MVGADIIVKCLEKEGVEVLFGYPGVAICPFFNSVLSTDIEAILVRTEQNAAHAASGYARVSGKVGVCVATSGPGATNLITGIATAYADSIPLVCITGQVETKLLGSDAFQEADITGACESFVKYSYLVKDVNDIPRIMKEAFHIASTGRKGPVLIDIPYDIQRSAYNKDFVYPETINMRTYKPTVKGNSAQIKRVFACLKDAKKPLILAGGGVILSDARKELSDFAHKYKIPVVTTLMGIGSIPYDDPYYFGMMGNNGKGYSNKAAKETDFIIILGARIADRAIGPINNHKCDLVHIDVDPAEIGKQESFDIPLVGDIKNVLLDMMDVELESDFSDWINTLNEYKNNEPERKSPSPEYVDPAKLISMISDKLDDDAIYVADVGQNQMWSCGYYKAKHGFFLTSGGMGTMGYSIPAAMGAKRADKSKQVVAVCGDGSFQMSMMELGTMQQYDIPTKIFIFHNGYLGLVREHQHGTYDKHYSVVDLSGSPEFEHIAKAYNMDFMKLSNMDNLSDNLDKILSSNNRMLIEVMIDPMDTVK